jgi:hypothetical protein
LFDKIEGEIMSERAFKTESELENTFINYISECETKTKLTNIAGFCVFAHINRDTFYAQKEIYPDTFKRVNDILEDATINCKDINDTFKIFYMKNKFGYKDKQENINVETSYEDYIRKVADKDEY